MSYETNLKNWGSTGLEYPDNYNYEANEQPVDEWDNFFNYNVIEDLAHLIEITNNDFVRREGGELESDLNVLGYSITGDAGSIEFDGLKITVRADLDVLETLNVTNDITVGGEIDGVNLSTFQSNTDNSLDTIETDLNELESDVDTHTLDESNPHNVTHSQVDAPSQLSFDELETNVSGIETDLDNLQSSHNSLSGDVSILEDDFNNHTINDSAHHERYSDAEARLAVDGANVSIQGVADSTQSDLDELSSDVDTLSFELEIIETDLGDLENEFSSHEIDHDGIVRSSVDGFTFNVLSAGEKIENATVATENELPETAEVGTQIYVEEEELLYIYTGDQ